MKLDLRYIGWPLLLLTVLVWVGVGMFAQTILADEESQVFRMQQTQEAENKDASTIRLHALAQDTEQKRGQLDAILRVDVVSIVDMIEAAGKAAGVKLIVNNAQPENTPLPQTANGTQVIVTGFVVEAQGTFASLMHLIRLFETFPLPSKIGRFDMERISATGPGTSGGWRINAHIRILTTSDTSS
ncbi:MAG: hypothetical protein AAB804_01925 [Patescibacteria group bacterium]